MRETEKEKLARLTKAIDELWSTHKKVVEDRDGLIDENARLKRELEALRGG